MVGGEFPDLLEMRGEEISPEVQAAEKRAESDGVFLELFLEADGGSVRRVPQVVEGEQQFSRSEMEVVAEGELVLETLIELGRNDRSGSGNREFETIAEVALARKEEVVAVIADDTPGEQSMLFGGLDQVEVVQVEAQGEGVFARIVRFDPYEESGGLAADQHFPLQHNPMGVGGLDEEQTPGKIEFSGRGSEGDDGLAVEQQQENEAAEAGLGALRHDAGQGLVEQAEFSRGTLVAMSVELEIEFAVTERQERGTISVGIGVERHSACRRWYNGAL